MNRLILIAAAALLAPAAFAADPAPAAASAEPAATGEAVPPSTCAKPQIQLDAAGKLKNAKELLPQANAYQSCIDAYIAQRKQAVEQHQAIAKANRDAGNAAANEFNNFAAEISAAQQKKP